jgi:hypothetical protein
MNCTCGKPMTLRDARTVVAPETPSLWQRWQCGCGEVAERRVYKPDEHERRQRPA